MLIGTRNSPIDVMLVADVPEKPNLAFGHKHGNTERVNWSITKSFIVEAPSSIQPVEIFLVGLTTKVIQAADFKVGEKLAVIVITAIMRIEKPIQIRLRMDIFRMSVDKRTSAWPKRRKRAGVVKDIHVEAVFHIVVSHKAENIVVNVAKEVNLDHPLASSLYRTLDPYIRLHPPIPVEVA